VYVYIAVVLVVFFERNKKCGVSLDLQRRFS
jgi:hypothetical protein